jgi:hemolysin III
VRIDRPLPPAPLLRGWLHLVCFFLSIPAAVLIVAHADAGRGRVAAVIYAIGLIALFGVSGAYHRVRWSAEWRRRMQRLDHATIFVMIAGSYTPLCLLALRGTTGTIMLITAWAGAAGGITLALTGVGERRLIGLLSYIALGWAAVAVIPQLAGRLSGAQLGMIAAGGVLYTSGAIILGVRWPNPSPRVFGYHEVWHVMVVAGVVCHLIPIVALVGSTG